jgi:Tfp pilus assembly protein PilF
MCYMLGGQHEKAVEAFTRATEATPTNPTFRANRATALGLSGRDAEAQQEYRTVLGELDTEKNLGILARAREKRTAAEAPQGGGVDTGASNDLAAPAPTEPAPADESNVVPEA